MPTINDLDFGGGHPFPAPQLGQAIGNALVEGSRTIVWPRGRTVEKQDVTFWAAAWQGAGNQAAGSYLALRYMLRQLEELAGNPDMQPVFIQWAATGQSGGQYNVSTPHDGWYLIENVQPDYANFIVGGLVKVRMAAQHVAPASPSSLGLRWSGGALVSTYTGTPVPVLAYPVGSTVQVPTAFSRTGGEGAVPLSELVNGSTLNPALFVRPGTVAGLFAGGVRVYDTISTATNPIPAAPGFIDTDWVQVYGTQHDFVGDLIVTNGLVLLLLQVGQPGVAVYLWNTSLGTPGWAQVGTVNYNDSGFVTGTVREINLDRVGLEESRVRIVLSTTAGNYAMLRLKLQRGRYDTYVEFWPLTEANSVGYGLRWALTNAAKIGYTESNVADLAVTANATLAATTTRGFTAAYGTTANGPLVGWLYQNAPSSSQGLGGSAATDFAFGDASGPAQNSFRLYGFFALPFPTAPNLTAEAESGTLGTGWTSAADAGSSGGNAAKCASGTVSTNADLWGASWVPPQRQFDLWVRLRVASVASATSQMQIGWWDVTSGAFAASVTLAPNAAGLSTSYVWVRVATTVLPTAAHTMRFRAVTTATTTTDWFLDEAALTPKWSPTTGTDDLPGDLSGQFLFERETSWVRG